MREHPYDQLGIFREPDLPTTNPCRNSWLAPEAFAIPQEVRLQTTIDGKTTENSSQSLEEKTWNYSALYNDETPTYTFHPQIKDQDTKESQQTPELGSETKKPESADLEQEKLAQNKKFKAQFTLLVKASDDWAKDNGEDFKSDSKDNDSEGAVALLRLFEPDTACKFSELFFAQIKMRLERICLLFLDEKIPFFKKKIAFGAIYYCGQHSCTGGKDGYIDLALMTMLAANSQMMFLYRFRRKLISDEFKTHFKSVIYPKNLSNIKAIHPDIKISSLGPEIRTFPESLDSHLEAALFNNAAQAGFGVLEREDGYLVIPNTQTPTNRHTGLLPDDIKNFRIHLHTNFSPLEIIRETLRHFGKFLIRKLSLLAKDEDGSFCGLDTFFEELEKKLLILGIVDTQRFQNRIFHIINKNKTTENFRKFYLRPKYLEYAQVEFLRAYRDSPTPLFSPDAWEVIESSNSQWQIICIKIDPFSARLKENPDLEGMAYFENKSAGSILTMREARRIVLSVDPEKALEDLRKIPELIASEEEKAVDSEEDLEDLRSIPKLIVSNSSHMIDYFPYRQSFLFRVVIGFYSGFLEDKEKGRSLSPVKDHPPRWRTEEFGGMRLLVWFENKHGLHSWEDVLELPNGIEILSQLWKPLIEESKEIQLDGETVVAQAPTFSDFPLEKDEILDAILANQNLFSNLIDQLSDPIKSPIEIIIALHCVVHIIAKNDQHLNNEILPGLLRQLGPEINKIDPWNVDGTLLLFEELADQTVLHYAATRQNVSAAIQLLLCPEINIKLNKINKENRSLGKSATEALINARFHQFPGHARTLSKQLILLLEMDHCKDDQNFLKKVFVCAIKTQFFSLALNLLQSDRLSRETKIYLIEHGGVYPLWLGELSPDLLECIYEYDLWKNLEPDQDPQEPYAPGSVLGWCFVNALRKIQETPSDAKICSNNLLAQIAAIYRGLQKANLSIQSAEQLGVEAKDNHLAEQQFKKFRKNLYFGLSNFIRLIAEEIRNDERPRLPYGLVIQQTFESLLTIYCMTGLADSDRSEVLDNLLAALSLLPIQTSFQHFLFLFNQYKNHENTCNQLINLFCRCLINYYDNDLYAALEFNRPPADLLDRLFQEMIDKKTINLQALGFILKYRYTLLHEEISESKFEVAEFISVMQQTLCHPMTIAMHNTDSLSLAAHNLNKLHEASINEDKESKGLSKAQEFFEQCSTPVRVSLVLGNTIPRLLEGLNLSETDLEDLVNFSNSTKEARSPCWITFNVEIKKLLQDCFIAELMRLIENRKRLAGTKPLENHYYHWYGRFFSFSGATKVSAYEKAREYIEYQQGARRDRPSFTNEELAALRESGSIANRLTSKYERLTINGCKVIELPRIISYDARNEQTTILRLLR